MDAETVHDRTLRLLELAQGGVGRPFLHKIAGSLPKNPVQFAGLTFPNVLGMAAGFDKDVRVVPGLAALGFGHIEVGTLTARLVKVDPSTVRRLNQKVGRHGQQYHEQEVHDVAVTELQADERHGFAGSKQQPAWEAELMDPASKFILAHVQGARDETLIRYLLQEGASRVRNPQPVALFTDGLAAYHTLFPEIFGYAYYPARQGMRGPQPKARFRIPRSAAHV